MELGIIGAGGIGGAIAARAAGAGIRVSISNSRGPESLKLFAGSLGTQVSAVTKQLASQADIVVIAVPWRSLSSAVAGLDLSGRIVIDANNPIEAPDFHVADLGGKTSSEIVAALIPTARLVKAFNTLPPELVVGDPPSGGRRAIFLSGDDLDAKLEVSRLLDRMGYAPIDLGGLVDGGSRQQLPGGSLAAQNLVRFPIPWER